jgi:hypothetical protein
MAGKSIFGEIYWFEILIDVVFNDVILNVVCTVLPYPKIRSYWHQDGGESKPN